MIVSIDIGCPKYSLLCKSKATYKIITMKKKFLKFVITGSIVLFFTTLFISCDNDMTDPIIHKEESSSLSNKITPLGSNTIYEVDPTILTHFQHYCQRNAGPRDNTYYPLAENIMSATTSGKACGPTSYMMSAYCLAKYKDPNTLYQCNGTKLSSLYNIIAGTSSITINDLTAYANNYDNSFLVGSNCNVYPGNSSDPRTAVKTFMQNALTYNKFVIVGVNMYGTIFNTVNNVNLYSSTNGINPDLNSSGEITSGTNRNYISTADESSSVGGHIIVIIKITVNSLDGTGIVEYIDPLAKPTANNASNRRYVSYTRLLDAMKMNGANTQYDAVSIGLK